eukprot:8879264-Alexandrium_andersonii.AAC.1
MDGRAAAVSNRKWVPSNIIGLVWNEVGCKAGGALHTSSVGNTTRSLQVVSASSGLVQMALAKPMRAAIA